MARFPEKDYRFAVRRHHRIGKGTTIHSKHMTKQAAERSKKQAQNRGFKAYIVKLKK